MTEPSASFVKDNGLYWRGYCACGFETTDWLLSAQGARAELTAHQISNNDCKCGHPITHHAPIAFGRRCERTACTCDSYERVGHD